MPNASRPRLEDLYRMQLAVEKTEGDCAGISDAIEERSTQAAAVLALIVAGVGTRQLEEDAANLRAALPPDFRKDRATDLAEREITRVQLSSVEAELARRAVFREELVRGDRFAPDRAVVQNAMTVVRRLARSTIPDDHPAAPTLSTAIDTIRGCLAERAAGAPAVATALRASEKIHVPESHPEWLKPWLRWAITLELLASRDGEMELVTVDHATREVAIRARALFLAADRQDPGYEEGDTPLDLPGDVLADMLETAHEAREYWRHRRWPDEDLTLYVTRPRREEPGRPIAHEQIVPAAAAQEWAQESAIDSPLLYPIPRRHRRDSVKAIWAFGLPEPPETELGLSVFRLPETTSLSDWGPHPDGLLVSLRIPPDCVLSIGRGRDFENEWLLESLRTEAMRIADDELNRTGFVGDLLT